MSEDKKNSKKRNKRFHGMGSIYKMSGRRARPYQARIIAGIDDNGKYLFKYSYHETRTDAAAAISKMQEELKQAPISEDTLEDVWNRLKVSRYPKLVENTRKEYDIFWNHWKLLHKNRIADITTRDLEKIILTKKEMSFSYLSKMKTVVVMIFNEALKDDIVRRNYASLIELPKSEPESNRRAFSDNELQKIQKAAHEDIIPYADVTLFMCYTGWRPTEMCKLLPSDYNEENQSLTGGIKTKAGKNRVVPIHPLILPILNKWLRKNNESIFTDEKGLPLNRKKWAHRFTKVMQELFVDYEEWDDIKPYSTRDTCASILHAAGADHLTIAKIIGHKDYKITAEKYTTVDYESLKAAIDLLNAESFFHCS